MAQPESVHNSTFNWTTILKALADENRLQIIHELLKQEATVQDLSTILDIQMYNISKHLKILEANGLVRKPAYQIIIRFWTWAAASLFLVIL
jgi:DNA-binding transcriptional ArsR family regulator